MDPPDSEPPGPSHEPDAQAVPTLAPLDRRILREIAFESIESGLSTRRPLAVKPEGYSPALQAPGASFVTLKLQGQLRGCVGSLSPRRPLVEDVAHNAFAAAFRDSRFPPLREEELGELEVHLSRLTPLTPLSVGSRGELLAVLLPGEDGLVLQDPPHRATFLPQVWASLPEPEEFVSHLFLKAGLPANHWSDTLECFRYRVEVF